MDLVKQDDYDVVSERVRTYIAQKLVALEQALEPYVNGDMGDIMPGHAGAYITLLKELGRLYEVQKRPRDPDALIPAAKVEQILAEQRLRLDQEREQLILETELRVRRENEASATKSLESARLQVMDRLGQLRD